MILKAKQYAYTCMTDSTLPEMSQSAGKKMVVRGTADNSYKPQQWPAQQDNSRVQWWGFYLEGSQWQPNWT